MNEAVFAAAAVFTERLRDCDTREEWDDATYHMFLRLFAIQIDKERSEQHDERLIVFLETLKAGPPQKTNGRPRHDKERNGDLEIFEWRKPKTPADGARILMFAQNELLRLPTLSSMLIKTTKPVKQLNYSNALKRAKATGYPFPEKGARFRKQRKKP